MSNHAYVFVIITVMGFACSSHNHAALKTADSEAYQKKKKIPYYEDASVKKTRQQWFLKNLGKIMGLTFISDGKEGLYIRIWVWDSDIKYVIDISNDQLVKKCSITEFYSEKTDSSEYIVIHKEWKDLKPKSGWEKLFANVEQYQITSMKSGKIFKEQTEYDLTGGAYVQVEIAQPNQYRFYEYLNPSYYRYVNVGSNNIHKFLKYFNEQMNVKVYSPPEKIFEKPQNKIRLSLITGF